MSRGNPDVSEVVQRGLDAVTDLAAVDWNALASEAEDESRQALHALQDIARILRAHAAFVTPPPAVPFTWGALEVQGWMASGVHGDVYRAWDPRLDRLVALKLLRPEDDGTHDTAGAIDEGRRLARVRHPNVVTVHGADRVDGRAGIWMELLSGRTLHAIVDEEGPRAGDEAAALCVEVCAGLDAIHRAGLVHRDVKAQNVMCADNRVILMDLGAADDTHGSGGAHGLQGTPLYTAPELLEGGAPTVASDVYAVGVLLHYLLTGRYPVVAATLDGLRRQHAAWTGTSRLTMPMVPRRMSAVLLRALAPRPGDRFQSAAAMGAALQTYLSSQHHRRLWPRRIVPLALTLAIGSGLLVVGWWPPAASLQPPASDEATLPSDPVPLPAYVIDSLTPDGRYVTYVADGTVMRWAIETGHSEVLVRADDAGGRATSSLLSSDGKLAFAWRRPNGMHELRIAEAGGAWPRVVMPALRLHRPVPLDWSRDGRLILCRLDPEQGPADVVVVPTDGDQPRVVFTAPAGAVVSGVITADGRVVVSVAGGGPQDGLHLIGLAGGQQTHLVEGEAHLPQWMPDQLRVFFVRPHENTMAGWVVSAAPGQAKVVPSLVVPALGMLDRARITDRGVLYSISTTGMAEVYTAPIDPATGGMTAPPTRVDPAAVGNHVGPAWAPDGRRLAYFRTRAIVPGAPPQRTLVLRDVVTGQSRAVATSLAFVGGYTPRWAPDSRHLAIWGRDAPPPGGWGYFLVNVDTGYTQPLVKLGFNAPAWAQFEPDGLAFLYTHPSRGIVRHVLVSHSETTLVPMGADSRPRRFVLTPDGRTLALTRESGAEERLVTTIEIREAGGRTRECWRAGAPDWVNVQAWMPAGRRLLVAAGRADRASLWTVDPLSCERVDLRFPLFDWPNAPSVSPDGRRIAYAERLLWPELRVSRLSLQ